ncbi:recombinase family protein [Rhodococcus sp. ARC_M5]|uniref:recombinase family protein n=1 Tax=Rhodococcus sp. ARC_M5 TaxID=2928851 RepID=UPI001FB35C23|nr:recombinase family protein [Rhodococcus sp. ARC_M5]MCJ0895329.1 recombinase family protein [Rhodococcus sp. ARC_M5]
MSETLGYARVSTSEQTSVGQEDALRDAGCYRVWTDVASGATTARPQLDALLDALRPGDTLAVWRLDRLGRSLPHLLETVDALQQRGVGFKSLTESIDTTTSGGRLIFSIFGALAEFERNLIRERTNIGLKAARERGRTGGRPPKLTPVKLQQAVRMRADGLDLNEIAGVLGVSRTTLYRHLPAAQTAQ